MKNILIVDDASYMRLNLKKILFRNGFKDVDQAVNGEEAIKLYNINKYDLILLDITMPVMGGLEVLEILNTYEVQPMIIIISAEGEEEVIRKALVMGAKDFVVKPFKESEIVTVVKRHMRDE